MSTVSTTFVLFADLTCLLVFQWARMRYFRRDRGESRGRGGLGTWGTVLALMQLPLVAWGTANLAPARLVVSLGLFATALALFHYARQSHAQVRPAIASSEQPPEILVTSGAYRIARHPFYLAYMLFWAGAAVASNSFIVLASVIVMGVLYTRTALAEEQRILQSALAEQYRAYQARTGMFWPILR